ncbi:ABC transporter ATP-binding protein [Legionella longbeachae]|uniref:Putative multidrug resistance ABC transporter ATP-binding protein n=1 Tax=Legionella longbeachae serogroup 1 (strain NSW150) TaxID=661367 RepID=D3HRN7_LEGLN|nr:ABC transporter ATP-binding protein [Legionella longbeachae]VEE02070.1 multidrug resistance ABC transporter ATP-binding protein [Legionella oakridgensis]HBD7396682.1 ABC transporter ATP-binding protein [Legionella pneumophila]ARB91628.1 ABC transporter ATP-binding protein [Legionella longbeachae]ARM35228.1 ABC transporter ATP-binding protein [Legionella longbeachae]EEZ95317.1 multidrug resistance ABC transporter ATP binding protein [Legionella longbeachae D-4968]
MNTHYLPNHLSSFIWHFLKPYKSVVILFILVALLAGFWGPFNSLLIKSFINTLAVKTGTDMSSLYWIAGFLVLNFIVFDNVTWRTLGFLNYKYEARIKNQIISQTFEYVLGGSTQFFQDNLSGRIADQIKTLAENLEIILHRVSVDFLRGASLLIVSFITAYSVNAWFFYILLFWFIAFASFSIWMSARLVQLSDDHASSESQLSGQLVDSLANQSNVRIFSQKKYEVVRMNRFFHLVQQAFQKKELFIILLCCAQGGMIAVMMGFSSLALIDLYGKGLVSIGDFALILGLSMELGHMMWYTMYQVDQFNQALGKARQSLKALVIPHEINDKNEAAQLIVTQGKIEFSRVKFHYHGGYSLFQNKSVTIDAGQKVGLVGYSGSGKSTFVSLILRLYDVVDGQILIDGQNISAVTQESLRRTIAMIPQDPTLFHRSLMDNLRYGRLDASDEEVITASKKAHAHEFISLLPEGYDTLVGERGIKLSGGQRQRIAIARALLKNAPILMLDEATSQLDSITESNIQESLWELMQGKTTLVIAHRLSTLLHMDRILVFDKGHIVEDGTHTELLKLGGLYKTLWDAQVGGFLPDKEDDGGKESLSNGRNK